MAIECYSTECPFHSHNNDVEDEPFCFEEDCKQPKEEINRWERQRIDALKQRVLANKENVK